MAIVIPYHTKRDQAQPLIDCIQEAASRMYMTDQEIGIILTYFFEELAQQVASGNVVRIPGFGAFGSKTYHPKTGAVSKAYVAFSASRGFRNEVNLRLSGVTATEREMNNHRSNHSMSRTGRSHESVAEPMLQMRVCFEQQIKKYGIDPYRRQNFKSFK